MPKAGKILLDLRDTTGDAPRNPSGHFFIKAGNARHIAGPAVCHPDFQRRSGQLFLPPRAHCRSRESWHLRRSRTGGSRHWRPQAPMWSASAHLAGLVPEVIEMPDGADLLLTVANSRAPPATGSRTLPVTPTSCGLAQRRTRHRRSGSQGRRHGSTRRSICSKPKAP